MVKDKPLTTHLMTTRKLARFRESPRRTRHGSRDGGTGSGARYEDDVYTWALEQCALLEAGRFHELDVTNLIDEVGDVARREQNKLESACRIVVLHLLKWDHQPERRSRSWVLSILEHRSRIGDLLADSPGLKSRQDVVLERAYEKGRLQASGETGLPVTAFPNVCPYTWGEVLSRSFDPDTSVLLG